MEDLIERSDVIDEISHITPYRQYKNGKFNLLYLRREVIKAIKAIPAVEPKRGEWIGEGDGYADGGIVYDIWYCSNCDHCEEGEELALPNFCPNCGAKMKGVSDND